MQKGNVVALIILKQRQNKPTACEFYCDKEILTLFTAFDMVAESILGVSVKTSSALDDDGRKRVAWGVSGMNCYMTVEKTQGTYINYTIESMNVPDTSVEL